jgi:hypothetical protein
VRRDRRSRSLKLSAAVAGVFIATVFAINMLTSTDRVWFQWPTLGVLVVLGLRAAWLLGR